MCRDLCDIVYESISLRRSRLDVDHNEMKMGLISVTIFRLFTPSERVAHKRKDPHGEIEIATHFRSLAI
jgi:hypothetical protein